MVSLSNKHACIILYHHDRYHHGFMNDAITKTGSLWKFIHINSFCIIVCRLDLNTPQGSWVFAWLSDCSMSDANNTAHMSCSVSFQVALPAYKSYFRCSLCLKWQKMGVVSHKTSQWAFKHTIETFKQKQRAEGAAYENPALLDLFLLELIFLGICGAPLDTWWQKHCWILWMVSVLINMAHFQPETARRKHGRPVPTPRSVGVRMASDSAAS